MHKLTGWLLASTLVANFCMVTTSALNDDYEEEIETWRLNRERDLKADDGWLTVSALFFLREGENSFGSNQTNDLVLPDRVPPKAGVFELRNGTVRVRALADNTVTVDGEAVTSAQLYPSESRTTLILDRLSLWVHLSGERLAIRVRDIESKIRKNFTDLDWYPIDQRYRVRAKFTPHAQPITVKTMNILGDLESHTSEGYVTLTVADKTVRMLSLNSGKRLWFIMRDLTSGDETYPAARFLYADAPDTNGWTTVDFNMAYNPPCAFNPHTTCPLPPPDNRLDVRIEAGEKLYPGPLIH